MHFKHYKYVHALTLSTQQGQICPDVDSKTVLGITNNLVLTRTCKNPCGVPQTQTSNSTDLRRSRLAKQPSECIIQELPCLIE